jgi:hypothetical protein
MASDVWVIVLKKKGAHLCTEDGTKLDRFTLSQFLNKKVYLKSDGGRGELQLGLKANPTSMVTLRLISAPVRIQLDTNTGLKIPHRASRTITPTNLSFTSNFPEISIQYSVVDGAEFGLIECLQQGGQEEFQVCSSFTQQDMEKYRVRYRHTSTNRPPADSFSFHVS